MTKIYLEKNIIIKRTDKKPLLLDYFRNKQESNNQLIIFCHGFKGYKDWGAWNLMAEKFVEQGFSLIKFNFSHNGGTVENPIDFPDLESFATNNFTIEMDDLETIITWGRNHRNNYEKVHLIGHSRGGAIVSLMAGESKSINKAVTWAGVSNLGARMPQGEILKSWQESGVVHIPNARTHQEMPLYFQLYQDYVNNQERFDIKKAVQGLNIPYLIVHGSEDETIPVTEARDQKSWYTNADLVILEGADHSFGSTQPWSHNHLPKDLELAINHTISFLKK